MNETIPPPAPAVEEPVKEKEKQPILLAWTHMEGNQEVLKQKHIYVISCHPTQIASGRYYAGEAFMWVEKPKAKRYTWVELRRLYVNASSLCYYELVDQELAAELATKSTTMENEFTPGFIELLKRVPNNPQCRARILATTGKHPPPEADTYDKLKEWVEKNLGPGPITLNLPPPPKPPAFSLALVFSDYENGRCNYSCKREGEAPIDIKAEDLDEYLTRYPDAGAQAIESHVMDLISLYSPWAYQPTLVRVASTYEYRAYGATDNHSREWLVKGGHNALPTKLLDYLKSKLSPEEQRRRGIT